MNDLFDAIESPPTSAMLNAASGYKQFVRAMVSLPETKKLQEQVASSLSGVLELLGRVTTIAGKSHKEAYENPNDVALAIYLWVLRAFLPDLVPAIAGYIHQCPGCWWARKVAEALIAARPPQNASATTKSVLSRTRTHNSADIATLSIGAYQVKAAESLEMFGSLSSSKPQWNSPGATNRIAHLVNRELA